MKSFLFATALICLVGGAAEAQKMGMTNRNAPNIEQKMDLGSTGKLELSYTAITWAGGNWAKSLEDDQAKERMRGRINGAAKSNPLGKFVCDKDVKIGETRIAAGSYDMGFTLDDEYNWQFTLIQGDEVQHLALDLMDQEDASKRLTMTLFAGDEDFTGGIWLAFGNSAAVLPVFPAGKEKTDGEAR